MEESPRHGAMDKWSPDALRAIGRLDFIAKEVLDGVRQGLHRSIRRGFSSEFFDYKSYEPGDDAAKIDWRLYAKTGRFYIKRHEAETSLECMMLLDLSNSMRWRWRDWVSKAEYSAMLAASLGLLFNMQRDLVGLHCFGSLPERHLKPKGSTRHIQAFFSALGSPSGGPGGASLLDTARGLGGIHRHKGLLILFSDLEVPKEELQEALGLLRARGDELIVFHILDKAEIELPFGDATHIEDFETGETIPFDAATLRPSHRKRVAEFRDFAQAECLASGSAYVPLDTSVSCVEAILSMGHSRKGML